MKIAILNYTGERANWGCQATSIEFEKEIRRSIPDRGVESVDFMRVPLLPTRFVDRLVHLFLGRFIGDCLKRTELDVIRSRILLEIAGLLYRPYIHGLRECDFIFFQAEGTMEGQAGVFSTGLRLLLLPFVCQVIFKKPVFSLNQTIVSEDPSFTAVLNNCFGRFRMVAVREPSSQRVARELGLGEVLMIPDSAFSTEPSDKPLAEILRQAHGGAFFCVTGSAIINRIDWKIYLEVVRAVAVENKLAVALLCSTKDDLEFSHKAKEFLDAVRVFQVPESIGYREAAAVIAQSRFLIGGRYHLAILAATTHTPFIPLASNSHKSHGLVELLEYPLPVSSFDDTAGMMRSVRRGMDERTSIVEHLARRMAHIRSLRAQGEAAIRCALSVHD